MTQMSVETIKKARPDVEMIIVDNGSTFAPGYLREVADVYVRNQTNKGYPAAVNQGIALASGDILCISNNDIRVPENIFDVGLEVLKDPKIGSVHYKMIPYDQPFNFGSQTWIEGKERWCTSSFFLVKKECLPTGNYDLKYQMGGYDDWDFWHRIRHIAGWKTAYTNKSAYQHWGSWTLSKMPQFKMDENREYFKTKFGHYAEDIWNKLYPDQMQEDYYKGFE
jgi:glycosyltransferase involved in cell wall biosynthesis